MEIPQAKGVSRRMINEERPIEELLEMLARGGVQHLDSVLRALSREVLFLPINPAQGSDAEAECLSIPNVSDASRNAVPAFLTEDLFAAWSKGEHRYLALPGSDIAATVPERTWLIINPDTATEVEFSPEEVARMLAFMQDELAQAPEVEADDMLEDEIEYRFVDSGEVTAELEKIISELEPVKEGYYVQVNGPYPTAMLGLLTRDLDVETRFNLMAQIASVSKDCFGLAGAIEVYDDLNSSASASWDLFSALTPFFVRDDRPPTLRSEVEVLSFELEGKAPSGSKEYPAEPQLQAASTRKA